MAQNGTGFEAEGVLAAFFSVSNLCDRNHSSICFVDSTTSPTPLPISARATVEGNSRWPVFGFSSVLAQLRRSWAGWSVAGVVSPVDRGDPSWDCRI